MHRDVREGFLQPDLFAPGRTDDSFLRQEYTHCDRERSGRQEASVLACKRVRSRCPMLTNSRLMKAFRNARVEYFDENSRYIIFSDCHRGNNSLSDEFSRNQNIYSYAINYYYYNPAFDSCGRGQSRRCLK
jgi:hypothetical protein